MLGIKILLCFSFVIVAKGKNLADDEPDIEITWPDKYTCEAKKLYVGSGLIEDYKIWYTEKKSRVDYNKGATKTIVVPSISRKNYGIRYDIHPETDEEEVDHMACVKIKGTKYEKQEVQDILPSTYDFITVDNETINDIPVVKFYQETSEEGTDKKLTLWANYNDDIGAWIPIKYQEIAYNNWLGNLDKYIVWEFYNFATDFSDDVFSISDYDCTEVFISDEVVTKQLLFMDPEKDEHVDYIFNEFKTKYNRKYAHKREHAMRKRIFHQNMRLIASRNRQNLGYKLSINEFADRTPDEMKRHKGLLRRKEGAVGNIPFPYDDRKIKELSDSLPTEYDARLFGLVSPIKNQQDCGSCWTFGTTAAVEGAIAKSDGGKLVTLSNQALIDCAWAFGVSGCDGGTDNGAYEWMMEYGLPTVEEYGGYLNRDGFCHIANMTKTYPIRGYTDVTPNSPESIKLALVNHGPLSTSVDASTAFSFYSGGIFYDPECSPTNLNHEVTLVGYGEENGEKFWILRNSWGPTWGIDGYMHISARDNICGVATEPTYVVV